MKYCAAIDLGTTNIKCAVFELAVGPDNEPRLDSDRFTPDSGAELRLIDLSEAECGLIYPSAEETEQDAAAWWDIICSMLSRAAASYDIGSVCVSSQGISVVPVDREFMPLGNAISWLDRRDAAESGGIFGVISPERYLEITARVSPAMYAASKISWIIRNNKEIAAKTHKYLMPLDYITARLCGSAVTDHSMAAGTAAYDMRGRKWSPEILGYYNIDVSMLPVIQNSGTVAGYATGEAAAQTGLKPGTIIAVGAQDQKCGALGAGLRFGAATLSMGTAFALTVKLDKLRRAENGFIPVFADISGDGYAWESCINTGGAALQWCAGLFGDGYGAVNSLAAGYKPYANSPLFIPHLSGCGHPRMYADASGGFYGLKLGDDKAAMYYSVMEGVAFTLRQNINEVINAGLNPDLIYAFGGGARSDAWLQIIADITGVEISAMDIRDAPCAGAAILAARAYGVPAAGYRNEARRAFKPRAEKQPLLKLRYEKYNGLEKKFFG